MNKIKSQPKPEKKTTEIRGIRLSFKYLDPENVFNLNAIRKNFKLILFCFLIGIIYISSTKNAERLLRRKSKIEWQIEQLRTQYITLKFEMMDRTKQSNVAALVDTLGLKELTETPRKIYVEGSKK
jgi:hypothetical protein